MPTRTSKEKHNPAPRPPLWWLSGLALVLALAAGLALALAAPGLRGGQERARGLAGLLDGRWSRSWEQGFERGLLLRRPAAALWALLRWGLFAEGNRGVLVGDQGWLFTAEEFQEDRELDPALQVDLAAIREVRDELQARGSSLVVALVPAKARVYPDRLGRYALPAEAADRYGKLRGLLAGLGLPAPDLLGPLLEARQRGEVFLRNDTHWTPLGAGAAADALAGPVADLLREAGSPRARFESAEGPPREYRGDLLNFLPLGPFERRLGPRPDIVNPRLTAAVQPEPGGLFDQPAIPVVLVGTSYSAGELWNLEGALKTAVQADVLNVARQGQGALAPMRDLLAGPVLEEVRADGVVWEIPERYFTLP
jgi:alginate O-acetyltransferase complex protein AlgJ